MTCTGPSGLPTLFLFPLPRPHRPSFGEHWETLFRNEAPNCGPVDHKLTDALPTSLVTMCVWEFRIVWILEKQYRYAPDLK